MSSSVPDKLVESAENVVDAATDAAKGAVGIATDAAKDGVKKLKRPGPLRLKAAITLPLLFGAASVVYSLMIDDVLAEQLTAAAAAYAGDNGEASVGNVSFTIFGPKLTIENLRAWQNEDSGEHEVVYLGRAVLDIEFWPLLERRLVINEVSATEMRFAQPIREPEDLPPADLPDDTESDTLNEYLKQAREFMEGKDLDTLREWLDKLQEYTERGDKDPAEEDKEPAVKPDATVFDPGPADRAWYVKQALYREEAKPRVLVRRVALEQFTVSLGEPDGKRFVSSVSDLELVAEEVNSDPVAYGKPMLFRAAGNLDGSAERRVELGLTLRFDPTQLLSLEQVDGSAKISLLDISGLIDADIFGGTLRDAHISLQRYAPTHSGMSGRTRLQLAGALSPPGFNAPAKGSFALWFGGYGAGEKGAFAPSGISVQIEDFPLDPILGLAGGSPLPLEQSNATITFGTCDENGAFGTPGAALSWHNGLETRLRVKVNGVRFAEQDGELAGLPAQFVLRGLNRVVDGMGGLDVMLGFRAGPEFGLNLERPGIRAFADALINALSMTPAEIESLVDLPFTIESGADIGLRSVNADGGTRDPRLNLDGEARHDLNDLRVSLDLRNVRIVPRAGQSNVAGLPADDFCRAFNRLMESLGDEGLSLRTRLMNAEGTFSPALESPGTRGLVDAMIGVLDYTGTQLNSGFDLPVRVSDGATVRLQSIDADGNVRNIRSPGADSHSLSDLRVRVVADALTVSPLPGRNDIMGLPATDFCKGFNAFLASEGNALTLTTRLFAGETFSPSLESPGTRGLVDVAIGALAYTGAEFAQSFSLPVNINNDANIRLASVDGDGTVRTLSSPGAERDTLADLRVRALATNLRVSPKPGQTHVAGIPSKEFCNAFNTFLKSRGEQGVSMDLRVLDAGNRFDPALERPGTRGLMDGVANTQRYSGTEANQMFNLPFELVPQAAIDGASIDAGNNLRRIDGPDSGRHDMGDFILRVNLRNGFAAKKPGHDRILGVPAEHFTYAWNRLQMQYTATGFPMRFRLFDSNGHFAPQLVGPTEQELLRQVGSSVGINDFARNFPQLAQRFPQDFDDFQRRGIDAARDILGGRTPPPERKEEEKEPEKQEEPPVPVPPLPRLPWQR